MIDLVHIIKTALVNCGCSRDLIEPLDNRSPIQISFDNFPAIVIEAVDSPFIRLCTRVQHASRNHFFEQAAALMPTLMAHARWSLTGALCIYEQDGLLTIQAAVSPHYSNDAERFSYALQDFTDRVEQILTLTT